MPRMLGIFHSAIGSWQPQRVVELSDDKILSDDFAKADIPPILIVCLPRFGEIRFEELSCIRVRGVFEPLARLCDRGIHFGVRRGNSEPACFLKFQFGVDDALKYL